MRILYILTALVIMFIVISICFPIERQPRIIVEVQPTTEINKVPSSNHIEILIYTNDTLAKWQKYISILTFDNPKLYRLIEAGNWSDSIIVELISDKSGLFQIDISYTAINDPQVIFYIRLTKYGKDFESLKKISKWAIE